jgi:ribosome-binding factor A
LDLHRTQRVTETIREELDELISYELSDPRVERVTVANVIVSPDLRQARVLLSLPGDTVAQQSALAALVGAKQFLRRHLAERLQIFRIPDLTFEPSLVPPSDPRMRQILKRVRKGRPRDQKKPA